MGYTDLEQAALWHQLRYPGIALAPVAYLVVALRYAGYERWLSWRTYAVLGAMPVVTTVIVWTNPVHGLYWESLTLMRVSNASVIVETFGPWRPINLGYLYLVTVVSLGLLGAVVVRSGPIYRKQALTMFVGGLVPLATNVANNIGLGPDPGIDFTATALTVTGLTFALALFYLDILEIRPIARDRLLDQLDDGVVVIGPNNRIRDYNPTAATILGDIEIDQSAEELLPSDIATDGGELVVETDSGPRRFRTHATPLTDEGDRQIGRIIYLNEITDLVEREQRITVLNRILRHNIRNELNLVTGHLEMLEDDVSPEKRTHLETARGSAHRVMEFANKARLVEQTLRRSDTSTVVSATSILNEVVAAASERYPNAEIDYRGHHDGDLKALVVDEQLFEMAITELVDNAVEHTDQATPRVVVSLEVDGDRVRVSVADNGPGIPEQERDVLLSREETHLDHSSGLGLWLVKWTTSLSAGDLSFADNDPRGTVVTLSLPSPSE